LIKRKDNHIVVLPKLPKFLFTSLSCFFISAVCLAQAGASVEFKSADDELLNIQNIAVTNVIDNVSGVYSKNLTEWLMKRVDLDHQWNPISYNRKLESDYLEPEEASKIMSETKSQALITSRILRGPQGMSFRMTLYVGDNGYPLIQESKISPKSNSLEEIKTEFKSLYELVHNRLPFDGEILSRNGNDVTINVGKNWNLKPGQTVEAVQILKIQRHPKLYFIVGAEKTILGKIKITKVDDFLSFGQITFEKEPKVLRVDTKILAARETYYPTGIENINDPTFGKNPKEWAPVAPPQFGKIILLAGFGSYTQNSDLATNGGTSASSPISPTIKLDSEIWINQDWYLQFATMQSAFSLSNPITGDSPDSLSTTLSSYTIAGGHNWLLGPDFFGPKMQLAFGIHQWVSDPDQSTQVAFTRMQFGGMYLGFQATFGISEGSPWDLGAQFKYYLTKNLTESKSSGNSSSINMIDFSVLAKYRKSIRMSYVGYIIFENYGAEFSGASTRPDPASKTSHKNDQLLLGLEYAF
jgi:hypothetical protein